MLPRRINSSRTNCYLLPDGAVTQGKDATIRYRSKNGPSYKYCELVATLMVPVICERMHCTPRNILFLTTPQSKSFISRTVSS